MQTPARETAGAAICGRIVARLDPVALGASLAVVCGAMLLLATNALVLKGGQQAGSHLVLLSQYLPGYRITPAGSIIGALYVAAGSFLLGWLASHLRNFLFRSYLRVIRFWANLSSTYFMGRFD